MKRGFHWYLICNKRTKQEREKRQTRRFGPSVVRPHKGPAHECVGQPVFFSLLLCSSPPPMDCKVSFDSPFVFASPLLDIDMWSSPSLVYILFFPSFFWCLVSLFSLLLCSFATSKGLQGIIRQSVRFYITMLDIDMWSSLKTSKLSKKHTKNN